MLLVPGLGGGCFVGLCQGTALSSLSWLQGLGMGRLTPAALLSELHHGQWWSCTGYEWQNLCHAARLANVQQRAVQLLAFKE